MELAIEKHQSNIVAAAEKASADAAAIATAKASSDAAGASVLEMQTKIGEALAKAAADATAIAKTDAETKALLGSMADVTGAATDTFGRVRQYETDLQRLNEDFNKLHAKVEGLLPNATSAGLASAFRNQKARFNSPQLWKV